MFDLPTSHIVLKGRVLICADDHVIEDGFVDIDGVKIKAVGRAVDVGQTGAELINSCLLLQRGE